MNLNISREWLLKMAEKEANGIISVGGLASQFFRISDGEPLPADDPAILTPEDRAALEALGTSEELIERLQGRPSE